MSESDMFVKVRDLFYGYFSNRGYVEVLPMPINQSDSKKSFIRSINSRPAYEHIKFGSFPFGSPRIFVSQPVVRPEDFLHLDFDVTNKNLANQTIANYRCGMFEMLAVWHAGPAGTAPSNGSNRCSFFTLLQMALCFFRDELALDPERMWFSLWPGGSVANGKGYIPKDTAGLEFLKSVWGAKDYQIAWDTTNIWPDPPNQNTLDPDRTGLIAPRFEMYYRVSGDCRTDRYPRNVIECARMGYMELLSAIPLKWIDDRTTGEFSEIPDDKTVSEIAFGLERAAMCVEGACRVRDIQFYTGLKKIINDTSCTYAGHTIFHDSRENDYYTFCKAADRLRFLIIASYYGVDFSIGARGATLRMYARELFEILRALGLDNRCIIAIEEKTISYLANYYPFLNSPMSKSMNDFVFQQLNPAFVLGKKYRCSRNGQIQEQDVIHRANRGAVHRPKKIAGIE